MLNLIRQFFILKPLCSSGFQLFDFDNLLLTIFVVVGNDDYFILLLILTEQGKKIIIKGALAQLDLIVLGKTEKDGIAADGVG